MAAEHGSDLVQAVVVLAAGVVAVPLFRRLGLGSVLGYLAAGLAIGPFGLRFFQDPQAVLHVAELGVVMFLFVIGLEMQPSRLWGMRRDIFGSGLTQVAACGGLLTALGWLLGFPLSMAFLAAMGFVLSSTAIVMQILEERGETSTLAGQRIVSILLLEDLAIVPLLAVVAVLAPVPSGGSDASQWVTAGIAVAAIAALVAVSHWLLTPVFSVLANAGAREVMTGAALLVVLGAALAMQAGGLSMAMGAFAAGVMLSESPFRRQLETDIEPFRGILLGLFFMGVGMSLDVALVGRDWQIILAGVVVMMAVKSAGILIVARMTCAGTREALHRAALMGQGGEFAFVLYAAATAAGIFEPRVNAVLTAVVVLSMALTPLVVAAMRLLPEPAAAPDLEGVEGAERIGAVRDHVLMIGFGRFGQVASQALLARGIDITIIESDTEMIRAAAGFGFKVYYGDGRRLDVLHASGAGHARAVLVCTDRPETTTAIVRLLKAEFPLTPVMARAYDRPHVLALLKAGVDFHMRETLESALAFGTATLRQLGVEEEALGEIEADIRRRDRARLELEGLGEREAARALMHGNRMVPKPLTRPRQAGQALSQETEAVIREAAERDALHQDGHPV
ncbi:monovalent cation:proton antiporter-2 (CPA2) family protein [Pseudoroseomonas ludipueritiae]|uniref:Cation:proton antiporter n=1 Tax=Pseudoroseomonas ludipueritiae TaxID=198093 RepID=A0ABR7R3Z8_9PROT|nr:monovalent cation:proton antiporter-2 (CPA2) family protein [Pseudoroseomonas ludipueritiae]MBC9176412.1 cation:proton antiporter [Pseudoroseomonas ludipueritiae]MCG7360921.1 monovalent cation:proton antiporter-2 (CPA2) family protein [Roseomonas sp. ACRSG]